MVLVLHSQISGFSTNVVPMWLKQVLLNLPGKKNAWLINETDSIVGTWLLGI